MTHYRLKPELSITAIGDETVLLDLSTGKYFGLNDVGSEVIEALKANHGVEQIVEQLVQRFDVGQAQALNDTQTLLDQLRAADLVEVTD